MTNLTSELVEEFRTQMRIQPQHTRITLNVKKLEEALKTAFDRVRAEGQREAVEYIRKHWKAGQTAENAYTILDAASGDIAS